MTAAPAGERYGEVPGYYFERRRATIPGVIGTRTVAAGDVVNVIILAGGQQREFRYRVASRARQDATKKRVLVVAAEDYNGVSPNVTPGYDTAPRYLDTYKTALEGLGYEVATYDVDAPPANGGTPNGVVYPQIKYPTYLGVLSHFDAVVYETGDDFVPQDITETNPRRMTSATAQTGSLEMARWAHHVMLELRDYANEGGKLVVAGRNVHQPFTEHEREPLGHRPVHVDAGQAVRLLLPGQQRRRRRPARHGLPALARRRPTTPGRTTSASSAASPASASAQHVDGDQQHQPGDRRLPGRAPRPAACSTAWRRS